MALPTTTASYPSSETTSCGRRVSAVSPASRRAPAMISPISPVAPCFEATVTRMFNSDSSLRLSSPCGGGLRLDDLAGRSRAAKRSPRGKDDGAQPEDREDRRDEGNEADH